VEARVNIFYRRTHSEVGLNWLGWLVARTWAMPFITLEPNHQLKVCSGIVRTAAGDMI
jgi:hypothetical protein